MPDPNCSKLREQYDGLRQKMQERQMQMAHRYAMRGSQLRRLAQSREMDHRQFAKRIAHLQVQQQQLFQEREQWTRYDHLLSGLQERIHKLEDMPVVDRLRVLRASEDQMRQQLQDAAAHNANMQQQLATCHLQYDSCAESHKMSRLQMDVLENKLQDARISANSSQETVGRLTAELQAIRSRYDAAAEKQEQKLILQKESLRELQHALEGAKSTLAASVADMSLRESHDVSRMRAEVQTLTDQLQAAQAASHRAKLVQEQKDEQQETKMSILSTRVHQANESIAALEEKNKLAESQFETERENYERNNELFGRRFQELLEERDALLREKKLSVKDVSERLNKQIAQLQSEKAELLGEHQRKLDEINAQQSNLLRESSTTAQDLARKLTDCYADVVRLQSDLKVEEAAHEECTRALNALKSSGSAYPSSAQMQRIEELEKRVVELSAKSERDDQELVAAKEQVTSLTRSLEVLSGTRA